MLPYLSLDEIEWSWRYKPSPELAICIFLTRLAYPLRLHDIIQSYGRSQAFISSICTDIVIHITRRFKSLLEWDPDRLTVAKLQEFADVIEQRSGADRIWGFLDGTLKPICRPSEDQRLYYSGHKHFHGFKYLGVITPDGLFASLYGPVVGSRGDWFLWRSSGLEDRILRQFVEAGNPERLFLYGDPAFTGSEVTMGSYRRPRGGMLSRRQQDFNTEMSKHRISVEHGFGDVANHWMKTSTHLNNRIGSAPVAAYYLAAVLMTNILNCMRGGNQVAKFFGYSPPSLDEYFMSLR